MNESIDNLLENLDLEDYLTTQGLDFKVTVGSSGTQLNLRECPRCGGTSWKVYLNAETGLGNCFHGSCANEPGFNAWSFVSWLLGRPGAGSVAGHLKQHLEGQGWRPRKQRARQERPKNWTLPQSYPITPGMTVPYLEERGFTSEIADYFGWRGCDQGFYAYQVDGEAKFQDHSGSIVIPVYDLDGKLVTFQSRDAISARQQKYLFPPQLPGTGRYLYNGHNAIEAKSLILCEGAFDVAAVFRAIKDRQDFADVDVAGTFGKSISTPSEGKDGSQIEDLLRLKEGGLEEVVLMWDGEAAAIDSACKAALTIKSYGLRVMVATLPGGRDPAECSEDQVIRAFYQATAATQVNLAKLRLSLLLR